MKKQEIGVWKLQKKFILVIYISLIFQYFAVLSSYGQPQPGGPLGEKGMQLDSRGPAGEHDGIFSLLKRELKLTPDQKKKFKAAHLIFQKKRIQLHSEKAQLELDLKNIFSSFPVNTVDAMKVGEKVAEVEGKLVLLRTESWSQFLAGLTSEQHSKAMEIQEEFKENRNALKKKEKNRTMGLGN